MQLSYREMPPPASLHDLVECAWTMRGSVPDGATQYNRVLPDGCMDVIFNLSSNGDVLPDEQRAFVVGTMTRAEVYIAPRRVDFLGIRFRPGGITRILGACASELTNGSQPLATWFGAAATLLTERLAEQDSTEVRLNTMWSALHDRVGRGRSARRDPLVRGADTLIHASRGSVSITDLASQLTVSERTMERVFAEEIGLSPKLACRIARFRHAIDVLHGVPEAALGRVAYHTGYFDQPHFNREFMAFAGITPREWQAERAPVGSVQSRRGNRR